MPSFGSLSTAERKTLVAFLFGDAERPLGQPDTPDETPEETALYSHTGYNRFLDPDGNAAVKPPWGTLNAIDLNKGTIAWTVTLGELPELDRRGIPPTGTENYGGPVATAGGLLFIGATKDEKFRALDRSTGRVLWETSLPAGGYATLATYAVNGKQFVVIAAGGGKMGTRSGDAYVAFALSEELSNRPVFTLLYNDNGKPHRHVLAQGTTTVGRAPGNDLILHHGSVSAARGHGSRPRSSSNHRCRPAAHLPERRGDR